MRDHRKSFFPSFRKPRAFEFGESRTNTELQKFLLTEFLCWMNEICVFLIRLFYLFNDNLCLLKRQNFIFYVDMKINSICFVLSFFIWICESNIIQKTSLCRWFFMSNWIELYWRHSFNLFVIDFVVKKVFFRLCISRQLHSRYKIGWD